jgi:hypothetical protein
VIYSNRFRIALKRKKPAVIAGFYCHNRGVQIDYPPHIGAPGAFDLSTAMEMLMQDLLN